MLGCITQAIREKGFYVNNFYELKQQNLFKAIIVCYIIHARLEDDSL
jgi:hypothetical protein